jgi:hypothetical protein
MRIIAVGLLAVVGIVGPSACGSEREPPKQVSAPVPSTTPPPRVLPTTAPPEAPSGTPTTPLEQLQYGVVGRWQGKATFVDDTSRSWSLWIDLHANGHYAAGCLDDACVAAFNEGNDGEYPAKNYAIYDLSPEPGIVGIGELYILYGADGTVAPAMWRATLLDVRLSPDGKVLTFIFKSGPVATRLIRYELRRVG